MKKALLVLLISLMPLSIQPSASAHSSVAETQPAYKSTLNTLPSVVSIRFSEEPLVISGKEVNTITVTDPEGEVISASKTVIDKEMLTVDLLSSENLEGTYGVRYRMASADGHVISGNYEFYLGAKSVVVVKTKEEVDEQWMEHFFHLHREHIAYALATLIVALGWLLWRKRRNEG
jgi:methionine-rich copper-binding protein CopC